MNGIHGFFYFQINTDNETLSTVNFKKTRQIICNILTSNCARCKLKSAFHSSTIFVREQKVKLR